MLKVHFVAGTRAGRVVWLLEELGLQYEVNIMPFTKEGLKSPEHRSRHALGRVPVIEDGDVSIFESGAIIQYILDKYGNGRLKGDYSVFTEEDFTMCSDYMLYYVGYRPEFIAVITEENEWSVIKTVELAKEMNVVCKVN